MPLEKKGLVKLNEEMCELGQVTCKKSACMETDEHWDGAGSLKERMEDETGDVLAAIDIVSENFELDPARIEARRSMKLALFRKWMDESEDEPGLITPAPDPAHAWDETLRAKIGDYDPSELRIGKGVAVVTCLPFTAPWMSPYGTCLINITDLRRSESGAVEFQLAGEDFTPYDDGAAWCLADRFYSEWPD